MKPKKLYFLISYLILLAIGCDAFANFTVLHNAVAGYRFEEGSGTTAVDMSGFNHPGALINAPAYVTGKFGQALSFNGTNQLVRIPNTAILRISGKITLSAWINVTAWPSAGDWGYIVGKGFDATTEAYYLRITDTKFLESGSYGGGDYRASADISGWSFGSWHHVVGLYDGANWVIYIDGVQAASSALPTGAQLNNEDVCIGAGDTSGGAWRLFNGLIDEVRIYSQALTAAQIRMLMLNFQPGYH